MATGKVKWFNNAKGYGFILPEEGGEDLFAHYSSIEMGGYKTLKAGQQVDFEIVEGPKGQHAVNIHAEDDGETDEAPPEEARADAEDARADAEDARADADSYQSSDAAPIAESSP